METLRLRIHRVQCVTETSGSGSDEILLGGTTIDATGDTAKLPIFAVSNSFDTGDPPVVYAPPRTFASFPMAADDTVNGAQVGWPRTYHVTFLMAEQDNGGFPEWAQTVYEKVKGEATKAVAAAIGGAIGSSVGPLGTVIGAAVGYVVGWVLDELFGLFKEWWEDDLFPPVTVGLTLPWGHAFGERSDSGDGVVAFQAGGGSYRLTFDWQLLGPPIVAGVFRQGSGGYTLWTQPRAGFEAKYAEFAAGGLRLASLSTYLDDATPMFTGAYRSGTDAHALAIGDWAAFTKRWEQLSGQGLRLTDIDSYLDPATNGRVFAGAFRAGAGGYYLWASGRAGFEAKHSELVAGGFRLVGLDTYVENGAPVYVGAWTSGGGAQALSIAEWPGFAQKWQELSAQGLRLVRLSSHMEGGKRLYAGVFGPGTDGHHLWLADRWDGFTPKWQELSSQGYRLVEIET
jgi:hypothetical protein